MSNLLINIPTGFEPKRKNRFILRFPSDLGIAEWYVYSTSRPSIEQNVVEIPFLNTSEFVVGRFKWNSISVTFRDPIGPSAAQALMEWVRLHSESVTGRQGYAAGYKKDIELELLDPTGVMVEKWYGVSAMLGNVNFNELAYDNDALADITADIQCSRWILAY